MSILLFVSFQTSFGFLSDIKKFDKDALKRTEISVVHLDGSVSYQDKDGTIIEKERTYNELFKKYGYIPNDNPDLQIATVFDFLMFGKNFTLISS